MKEGKCGNCERVRMIIARGLCGTCYPHWKDPDRLDRVRRKYAPVKQEPLTVIDCQVEPKREEVPHLLGELVEISRSCSATAREAIQLAIELYGKEAEWYGGELVEVDRFFPSSRLCSACGAIKDDLTLNDRVFICECGYVVDRDLNAALNIERQALNIIRGRSGFTDSLNAQGQDVRPVIGRSWMNCENMAEERQPSNPAVV